MRSFEETRILSCPPSVMFGVVMDIEAYPQFLPWVAGAKVLTRGDHELTAELTADFAGVHHSFTTVDRFKPNQLVEIRLLNGPFRFLESIWTFEEIGEGSCRAHFSIEFEFKNMMLDMVASPIFSKACASMVHAFEEQAMQMKERG